MFHLKRYEAVNWNRNGQDLVKVFWDQQWKQIWFPEEIAVSKDVKQWSQFEHQETYKQVLAGLTLLDTIQTNIGMNEIARYAPDLQEKALYTVFASFEAIHAKSYSYIFTTLCTNSEIDAIFEWVKRNEYLQYKANRISDVYRSIQEDDPVSLWKAMFASVMLESFLFYSGFLLSALSGWPRNVAKQRGGYFPHPAGRVDPRGGRRIFRAAAVSAISGLAERGADGLGL